MYDWVLDNLEYIVGVTFFTIVGIIGKLLHGKQIKKDKFCPNLTIIENDLKSLKEQFEDFESDIKNVIETEVKHSLEVHKMIFDKINEISSKIDYTRGQVDQHLNNNRN